MAFIDELELHLSAGKGGDGIVHWHREKYRPNMGPDGGDGGKGGDVIIEAVSDLAYLENYKFITKLAAENGEKGKGRSRKGAYGDDLIVKLPVGSVVTNKETGDQWSLDEVGQKIVILLGGIGGLGNEYFKSSRNTTPYEWTPGKPGDAGNFHIELQMFADIGLVGVPSAGKSTLLNMLTNAKSKVAAYHFTTLSPHLGVLPDKKIIADIPGLISGAHKGKGLGHKFLRHIRRTKYIAHLVSCEHDDPIGVYHEIRSELDAYGRGLEIKPEVIVLSKVDMVDTQEVDAIEKELRQALGEDVKVLRVSAYDDMLLKKLSEELMRL